MAHGFVPYPPYPAPIRTRTLRSAASVLGCVLFVACGGRVSQDAGPNEVSTPIPIEKLVASVQAAICDSGAECCQKAAGTTASHCYEIVGSEWEARLLHAEETGAQYSAVQAGRCVNQTREEWSRCIGRKSLSSSIDAACADVFVQPHPTQTLGADCSYSMDCAQNTSGRLRCVGLGSYPLQICMTIQVSDLGGPCGGISGYAQFQCRAPYVCGPDRLCQARLPVGESCNRILDGDPCAEGAVCDTGKTDRCVLALPLGSQCQEANQCENHGCGGVCRVEPDLPIAYYCR